MDGLEFLSKAVLNPSSFYLITSDSLFEAVKCGDKFCKDIFCDSHNSCGHCENCIKFDNNNFVDYLSVSSDMQIKINDVRQITDFLQNTSYDNRYKCIHIKAAHNLTIQSQNYLLKVIEEPPKDVIFIMSTDNKDRLLKTIQSRAIEVALKTNSSNFVFNRLCEGNHDKDSSFFASLFSFGSVDRAIELLNDDSFLNVETQAYNIIDRIATKRSPSVYTLFDNFRSVNENYLTDLLYYISYVFSASLDGMRNSFRLNERATKISSRFTEMQIEDIINLINQRIISLTLYPQLRSDLLILNLIFDLLEVIA